MWFWAAKKQSQFKANFPGFLLEFVPHTMRGINNNAEGLCVKWRIRPLTVSVPGGKVSLNLSEVLSMDLMRRCQIEIWRGVGVADRAGFENRCAFGYRGFESRPLRFFFSRVGLAPPLAMSQALICGLKPTLLFVDWRHVWCE
jgi:hypothetical protein